MLTVLAVERGGANICGSFEIELQLGGGYP
jgi:hypothetical protein